MKGSRFVLAAAVGVMAGCGTTDVEPGPHDRSVTTQSTHRPSNGPGHASAAWPLPDTGDAVVEAMNRMPQTLGTWHRAAASRGMVFYRHPKGQLGIEGSDLEDLFIDKNVTAEEAVERLASDFAPGTSHPCSRPPYHCVLGESQGQPAMLWSHDDSDTLLVAIWPDDESHELLAAAWTAAVGRVSK